MKCLFALFSISIALGVGQLSSTYSSDDFGSLRVAGACSVTAERISCWDLSGKPDATMSEDIEKIFSAQDIPLNLKFKKRNRLIVLRHQPIRDATTHFVGELYARNGQKLKQSVSFGHNAEPLYSTYWYQPSETEKTLEVTASLDVEIKAGSAIPLKQGSETVVDGYRVKIGAVKASESNLTATAPFSRTWLVEYSVETPAGRPEARFNAIPVTSRGEQITVVDGLGYPLRRDMASQGAQLPAWFGLALNKAAQPSWVTKVNPDQVGGVVVRGVTTKSVTFKAVPLDPQK